MIYLEMSVVDTQNNGQWAFPNCVWAPTTKKDGSRWAFWEKIFAVRTGDTVLHLRGKNEKAFFVGYSTARNSGYRTEERPPKAGQWSYASSFYRADLTDYTPFYKPIKLLEFFSAHNATLNDYFDKNRAKGKNKKNIFYVRQSGSLRCLNGAYFSDVEEELLSIFIEEPISVFESVETPHNQTIKTGTQFRNIRTRLGQNEFSKKIKKLYGNKCCIPLCEVNDSRFLIGAHIARWSDNEKLRGNLGNGLCLCVFHDKAFEHGIFTLNAEYCVSVNPVELEKKSYAAISMNEINGMKISVAQTAPLVEAILEHQKRAKK